MTNHEPPRVLADVLACSARGASPARGCARRLRASMGIDDFDEPLQYLNDAIGKYWSRRDFDVAVVVGTASARKP